MIISKFKALVFSGGTPAKLLISNFTSSFSLTSSSKFFFNFFSKNQFGATKQLREIVGSLKSLNKYAKLKNKLISSHYLHLRFYDFNGKFLARSLNRQFGWNHNYKITSRPKFSKIFLPFYAFIGFGLVNSGDGSISILDIENQSSISQTKKFEHQKEVFIESKKIIERNLFLSNEDKYKIIQPNSLSIRNLKFGNILGKGCNAVVYEATTKCDKITPSFTEKSLFSLSENSPQTNFFSSSVSIISAISTCSLHNDLENNCDPEDTPEDLKFEMAVKIMFNYSIESNASNILNAMHKEIIPYFNPFSGKKKLPPHINMIQIRDFFVDEIPELPGCHQYYPQALPQRLNKNGFGRNQTLFVIMKRYKYTLREYLVSKELSYRDRCLLLLQLLEAVIHLSKHNIAHRDIKSDNILVEDTDHGPHLVLSDFGCAVNSLWLYYLTPEISKGGNQALMAPEIAKANPGLFSFLDYHKSDLWAVGTIAYEIFGESNPFYRSKKPNVQLCSKNYKEDSLPQLPENVPSIIKTIVSKMLKFSPYQRISAIEAADLLNIHLWCPSLFTANSSPGVKEQYIRRWLCLLSAESILKCSQSCFDIQIELKSLFVSRLSLEKILNLVS